ncbi:hypothetical protein HS088_TW01G00042 [Tripterygium wilfordii]|uniref:Nucleic acid-binding proteins superfamily n=1 Tax=Tripterygium wilfordii TaxID=458696 RepID=A0A7J7E0J4_TRIWF|nr:uncharacterized protein LOC119984303 [Tripterygium wilfordii]KAF5752135.1 hypothetical protein HS088_TW01G00042 [Tripterygium wilfordii]
MSHFAKRICFNDSGGDSPMEIDDPSRVDEQGEEDPFLAFVEYARSVVFSEDEVEGEEGHDPSTNGAEGRGPGWAWIVSRILKTCIAYSSGVTSAILLSDLAKAWHEQHRAGTPKKRPECINQLRRKHRRTKLPNTVTIDSIYEKNFVSLSSVLEVVIVDVYVLPGTNIYMLSLGDFWSSNTIDLYLHRRYYDLVDPQNGILRKGREVLLTGCYLRNAREGSGCTRLLPTEYLVILLDDDQDDDAILIGAQFCSDSFSSISLDEVDKGVSFSLYARIESIGSLEIQGTCGRLQRKDIALVDNDGVKLKFLLWGEQVLLSNLFSVGSMLALDRPYISTSAECAVEARDELCLEYGSATLLYLVPFIQHEEKICVPLTQNRCQGSRMLSAFSVTQDSRVSQVALPCDSQGTIDFSNYPFRPYIIDLHDKMTSISLYGVVTEIFREKTTEAIFSLQVKDTTGAIWAKLHFSKSWSLGRLGLGHTVFITGLSCYLTKRNCLELSWFENDVGASLTNLSILPAVLNSSCLHKLSCLSDLTSQESSMHICQVRVDQIDHCHVNSRLSHALCGNFVMETRSRIVECSFCQCNCDAEVVRSFHLKITLADESAKVFASCSGQTAAELLQISPDEFYELPEEEQIMYPSSLENERFVVMLIDCKRQGHASTADTADIWEITCALRCE